MTIRPESPQDEAAIREVNEQAFGRREEADLVGALRTAHKVVLSLIAVQEEQNGRQEQVVGHILFCPVVIETVIEGEPRTHAAIGLGPMAVLPKFQRRGVGSALVRAGLEALRKDGHRLVVVLGHPEFYPRFGFSPASAYGVQCQFEVPDEAFMLAELSPGARDGKSGTVIYPPQFNEV